MSKLTRFEDMPLWQESQSLAVLETKNFVYLAGRLDLMKQNEVDKFVKEIESIANQINAIKRYLRNNA